MSSKYRHSGIMYETAPFLLPPATSLQLRLWFAISRPLLLLQDESKRVT